MSRYRCQNPACDVTFPEKKKYHSEECRTAAREKHKVVVTVRCKCGTVETLERRPFGPPPTRCTGCKAAKAATMCRDSRLRKKKAVPVTVVCACGTTEVRTWGGRGPAPERCTECQKERDRQCHRDWLDGRRSVLSSEEAVDVGSLAAELVAARLRNGCAVDELRRQVWLLARDLGVPVAA